MATKVPPLALDSTKDFSSLVPSAFEAANAAYAQANSTVILVSAAFDKANTAANSASGVESYANAAFIQANAAFIAANTSGGGSGGTLLIYTDNFTANGNTTTFNLSTTPASEGHVTVGLNGLIQFRNTYTITGNVIIFDSTFENGSNLEVTTVSGEGITVLDSANNTNAAFIQANAAFLQANTGIISLSMPGTITSPVTGTAKYYPINTIVINTVYANLGTSPTGNFTFIIKKNGVDIGNTFTLSSSVMTPNAVNVSLTTSDYLTLDVTGVNGSDLSVKLKYSY